MNPTLILAWGVIAATAAAGVALLMAMMRNRTLSVPERQAWLILGVFGVTAVGFVILDLLLQRPQLAGIDIAGLLALISVSSLIGRRERREGQIVTDERDRQIDRLTNVIGYGVFWMVFTLACTAPLFIKGIKSTITLPTGSLIMLVYLGFALILTVKSLVVVILYRRGRHEQTN